MRRGVDQICVADLGFCLEQRRPNMRGQLGYPRMVCGQSATPVRVQLQQVPTCQGCPVALPGRPQRDDLAFLGQAAQLWDQAHADIGYLARVFAQTSLPYRNPGDGLPVWQRRNGGLILSVQPGPPTVGAGGTLRPIGYPYGTIPRLLLAWLSTEAVRRKERVIPLGESLSDFCRELDLGVTGGASGTIGRLRDQTRRLLNARISVHHYEAVAELRQESAQFLSVASGYELWWSVNSPNQAALLPSYVRLSEEFFEEVTNRPVPLDMTALRLLKGSPLRLDIYAWLTYRMSYLRRETTVPWESLMLQFGSQTDGSRSSRHKFKKDFMSHLVRVLAVYYEAASTVEETPAGLRLRPTRTHISRNGRRSLNTPDRSDLPAE